MSYQNYSGRRSYGGQKTQSGYHGSRSSYKARRPSRTSKHGQYIDPRRFVQPAQIEEQDNYAIEHEFTDFELNSTLQTNLRNKGYATPSPIQDQAIPVGLSGKDIIGIADTGTGKTAAFSLPIIHKMMADREARAIIIAPTRELALQIEAECRALGRNSGLSSAVLIGGSSMGQQLRDLRHRPRIIIGTPGRIEDHIARKTLDLSRFNIVVLDEVDRMLDMGFIQPIRNILGELASERQSFFFSATMDSKIRSLIDEFADEPVSIALKTRDASKNVDQNIIRYSTRDEKIEKLQELLSYDTVVKTIIFDETQRDVERLHNELVERGFNANSIHGGKNQAQRQRALRQFKARDNDSNILVATDVVARGIDVSDVTHVINYAIPHTYEDYVHRIGRAGRAGRKGYALTFVSQTNY